MGQFATGVCVVAVEIEQGSIAAMTINSFVSVSLEPTLVCWSLHNSSSQYDLFAKAERFTISILAKGQGELALRFAARGDTQIQANDFVTSTGGLPFVAGSIGYFECKNWNAVPAGDHTMLLGEVTGMSQPGEQGDQSASPLAFFQGQFCSIAQ